MVKDALDVQAICYSLLREDKIFTNETCTKFTTKGQDGYKTFT